MIIFGGLRACTRSIQEPARSLSAARLASCVNHAVSKRLADRRGGAGEASPIDDGPHRRIDRKTLGVVHVLVASETAEDRLPQQPGQNMSPVPAPRRRSDRAVAAVVVRPSASSSSR